MKRKNPILGINIVWRRVGQSYIGLGRLSEAEFIVKPSFTDDRLRWLLSIRRANGSSVHLGSFYSSGQAMTAADRVEAHPPEDTLANPVDTKRAALIAVAGAAIGTLIYLLFRSSGASIINQNSRVALIGDSLAVGLGPSLAKIAAAKNIPFMVDGKSGTTPLQWAQHAAACGTCGDGLIAFRPTVTLVELGTNEMGLTTPNIANYQTIRDGIQSLGSRVVWIQPNTMTKSPLTAVRKTINSLGVIVVPEMQVSISPDGVHPTPSGFSDWAAEIWQYLGGP